MDTSCRRTLLLAALTAAVGSGVPSTVHALATGRSVLASTRSAGTLLGRPSLARGVVAHVAISIGWTAVLLALLPRRGTVGAGAAAGLAIGVGDMAIADRHFPAIAALPRLPQLADHALFGMLVGAVARSQPTDGTAGTAASNNDRNPSAISART